MGVLGGPKSPLTKNHNNNTNNNNHNHNEVNWGMGLLFIFFHHNNNHHSINLNDDPDKDKDGSNNTTINIIKRRHSFPSSPSSSKILSRTQSTLSICGLLVMTTILVFTLSTFEQQQHQNSQTAIGGGPARRSLRENYQPAHTGFSISRFFGGQKGNLTVSALQGMGVLYRRGSKAMTDLVVGHVAEGAEEREVGTFLRVAHFSGLLSRADLVLVFHSPGLAARMRHVVQSESDMFVKVIGVYNDQNVTAVGGHVSRYLRHVTEGEEKETVWGYGRKRGNSSELTRASYGSVVGFDSSELDPEDSLSGFLDHVPMSLRRWACYPMLLGRLRKFFKHTMLVDVGNSLILSDPFSPVRNRSTESVFLWSNSEDRELIRHAKRREKANHNNALNAGVIVGGSRGVRRFANAALTEIVRTVIEHKGKGKISVTEVGLVNQLVHSSGHLLKSVNVMTSADSIPEASSLAGFNSLDSAANARVLAFSEYFSVVQRGHRKNNVDIDAVIREEICSSHELHLSVYRDCLASQ